MNIKNISKIELYRLYVTEHKSMQEIANILNSYQQAINKKLKKFNIPARNRNDARRDILINKRFHKLLVIELDNIKNRDSIWKCLCDCGNFVKKSSKQLKRGKTKSCGCLKLSLRGNKSFNWRGYEGISGHIWCLIKRGAKSRNINFNINIEYIWDLYIQQNKKCAISGLDIKFAQSNREHRVLKNTTASLDRIDSSKGYIEGNVQWVYKEINRMKGQLKDIEFINYCSLIYKYNIK